MEERLNQLEERLIKLEKKERKRMIIGTIKTIFTIIILAVIIIFGFYEYKKIQETIGPIEELKEKYSSFNWIEDLNNYFEKIK